MPPGAPRQPREWKVLFYDSIREVLPHGSGRIIGLRGGGCRLGRRGVAVRFTGRRSRHAVSLGELARNFRSRSFPLSALPTMTP